HFVVERCHSRTERRGPSYAGRPREPERLGNRRTGAHPIAVENGAAHELRRGVGGPSVERLGEREPLLKRKQLHVAAPLNETRAMLGGIGRGGEELLQHRTPL